MKKSASNENSSLVKVTIFIGLTGYAVRYGYDKLTRYAIEGGNQEIWDEPLDWVTIPNMFAEEEIEELMEFVHEKRRFLTGKEAFMEGVQHIGEGRPPNADGRCFGDTYLNNDGLCTIAGRYDLGLHHFMTGGLSGHKEFFEKLIPSIYAFYLVMPKEHIEDNKMFDRMFANPQYRAYMDRLCSAQGENYFFKPQQVNVVMVTPGQDLPLHYDNGWFWGANRFSMPDWLTVAMTRSGMFKDIEIPQAQSVVYLHGSKDKPVFEHGGEYVFYPDGPGGEMKKVPPVRGQGVIMNGGKTPHGGARISENYKTVHLGMKEDFQRLEYQGNKTWYLMTNNDIVDSFDESELRMSFVWRGLCFKSEEEANSYNSYPHIPLEEILQKFEDDMRARGVLKGPRPGPYEFGIMIVKTYTKMPANNVHGKLGFNHCILAKQFPVLRPLLAPFCHDVTPFKSLNDELPPPVPICEGRMHSNPAKCAEMLNQQ